MTIKHTRKDIGSEQGDIVLALSQNTPRKINNNNKKNYQDNLVITLTKQNQYNEVLLEDLEDEAEAQGQELPPNTNGGQDLEPYADQQNTITIPLTDLVRIAYLEDNYYTKSDIDARIKVTLSVVSSVDNLPAEGQSNYIYLIPFEAESNSSGDEAYENIYQEYIWKADEEEYELVGSTQTDLSDFLRIEDFDTTLSGSSTFSTLSNTVSGFSSAISSLQSHVHGNIDNSGKLNQANKILVSDSNKAIVGVDKINDSQVNVATARTNLGISQNDSLSTALGSIDTTVYNINANFSNYLLKSAIYDEIWGSAGFRSLQTAEASNSPTKTSKLGDYIYSKVYTKSDIDTLIGTLAQLQQQTLSIL